MNVPTPLARAFGALEEIEKANVDVSRLRSYVSRTAESNTGKVYLQTHPVLHCLMDLGRPAWVKMLRNPVFAKPVARLLNGLLIQEQYYRLADNSSGPIESASRSFRRTVLLGGIDIRYFDSEFRNKHLGDELPPTRLSRPEWHFGKASSEKIREYKLWTHRIELGEIGIHRRARSNYDLTGIGGDGADTYLMEGDEIGLRNPMPLVEISDPKDGRKTVRIGGNLGILIQTNSAFTGVASAECLIKPAGYQLLREVDAHLNAGTLLNLTTETLRFLVCAVLELLHGIPAMDCAQLGVNGNTRPLGHIRNHEIDLNLAGGFYESAVDAWYPKLMRLPLAFECNELIELLLARFPSARVLGDCRAKGQNFADSYRKQFKGFLRIAMPGYRGTAINLGPIWVKTGLNLDFPSSIVGMLRSNPLPSARGEAAYLSISHRELIPHLKAMQDEILKTAGTWTQK